MFSKECEILQASKSLNFSGHDSHWMGQNVSCRQQVRQGLREQGVQAERGFRDYLSL